MAVASILEYSASINTPQMIKTSVLRGGTPVKKNGKLIKYSGGFCVVFPFETYNKKYAVRCWHINVKDIRNRTKLISETIRATKLPYFVGFEYIPDGLQTAQGVQDIVVMEWVQARSLKKYISDNLNQPSKLYELANHFKKMVADLHSHNIAHGDLQHGNILVKDDGNIVLVDYDSMYVPSLSGYSDDIKGLAGYQHPARWKNINVNEKIDYFSEIIIYTSLVALSKIPNLWVELNLEDTETLLFSADDISSRGNSRIFQILDEDKELQQLSCKIKDFLKKDDINDIEPLEKSIIDPKKILLDSLSKDWKDNGYREKKQFPEDLKKMAEDISKSW